MHSPKEAAKTRVAQARRSIESQIERSEESGSAAPARPRPKATQVEVKAQNKTNVDKSPAKLPAYTSKTAEAKACLLKIKLQINSGRNIKTEIKNEVFEAAERLFKLVKEVEEGKTDKQMNRESNKEVPLETESTNSRTQVPHDLIRKLEEHGELLKQSQVEMAKLQEEIKRSRSEEKERESYASVASGPPRRSPENVKMHSMMITSVDQGETGEQVYDRIRKTINAREEGLKIDKIRKAKDRKVIVGCNSREELNKIKEKLKKAEGHLTVEEIKNKDPLVMLRDVLKHNSDDDIVKAISVQNNHILQGIDVDKQRMCVKYRRRARNEHTSHVVIQVSPEIWKRLTHKGSIHIDVQRIRVEDQSPLIQCSRCLGYGHGKRYCRDQVDLCSHCGGAHLKSECADWMAQTTPSCINCSRAKLGRTDHNAFSVECPVRRKWDALARSAVAYC